MQLRPAGLRRTAALALGVAALLPAAASAATPAQVQSAVNLGTNWLRSQQDAATGEIPGFGGDWSLSAFASAGVHAADIRKTGPSAQDFYATLWGGDDWAAPVDPETGFNPSFIGANDFERAILQTRAAGLDAARLSAKSNLVAQLASTHGPGGTYGTPGQFSVTIFGLLALAETPAPTAVLADSARTIRANRHDDGGWGYTLVTTPAERAAKSDIDITGAALAALCTAGARSTDPAVAGGIFFLRSQLDNATGAFEAQFGRNTDSNAWAVAGLRACRIDPQSPPWTTTAGKTPLDFLIAQQRMSGPYAGSFKYSPDEDDSFINLYTSQDAVRALAGGVFSARTPARANPADPARRPRPKVARGTKVPVTLAVDDGRGDIRLCRVDVPAQIVVWGLLGFSKNAGDGCVTDLAYSDGVLTTLNGKGGSWSLRVNNQAEEPVGSQPIGFGAFVYVRRYAPGQITASAASLDLGTTKVGRSSAPKDVYIRLENAPERLTASLTGSGRAQFTLVADGCTGKTVQPGAGCQLRVRFNPTATGTRNATLRIAGSTSSTPVNVALTGKGS
jgi:hypothetical protein